MKKFLCFLLVLSFCPMFVGAEESTYNYDKVINILQETMKAYYMRGPYFQYNYAKAEYGKNSPEQATSQDNKYNVCAAFTYDVYVEALGMTGVNTFMSGHDEFKTGVLPIYNYHIVMAAQAAYKEIKEEKIAPDNGSKLLYYQSTTDKPENDKETVKINGEKVKIERTRKVVKYVYGDSTPEDIDDDFETLVNNVKPGDMFVYSGHALIAYDTVDRNGDGTKDDVLILNSTPDESIYTRVGSTSLLSFNLFKNGENGVLDVDREGSIQWLWLSEEGSFIKNGKLDCRALECAVIRPIYEDENGNAISNYSSIDVKKYEKGNLRTEYPGLFIEKTVDVGDNDVVHISDKLTYKIKITNNSNITRYNSFIIEEKLNNSVEYDDSSNNGEFKDKVITWKIDGLADGESIELTYTVKVKDDVSNVGIIVNSSGSFYSSDSNLTGSISTGTIKNKIVPNVSNLDGAYTTCYNDNKTKSSGLELIDDIYSCVDEKNEKNKNSNIDSLDVDFTQFNFDDLFVKNGTTKTNSTIMFNPFEVVEEAKCEETEEPESIECKINKYCENHTEEDLENLKIYYSKIKDMILNNYYSGLVEYNSEYFLPPFTSNIVSLNYRARTINSSDFKNGDVLIYEIDSNEYTAENGVYAYIYIDDFGGFVGINGTGNTLRNEFTYNYYETEEEKKQKLYGGYPKLEGLAEKEEVLEFVNLQTLYGKDNYIILRPELVMEEFVSMNVTGTTKKDYIQNYENLDLTGGKIEVTYNNKKLALDLSDEKVKVTGFDNSKIGKKTLTVEYEGHTTSFDVNIISKQSTKIEVTTKPLKTNYIQNYEDLDLEGGVIIVTYNDETKDTVSLTNDNVKVTGFDNSKIGKKTITVEYEGLTDTFDVNIISKQSTKIEVTTKPLKTNYIQNYEDLDLEGGEVTVTYNDKSKDIVSLSNDNVKVTGFDNSKIGKKTITVEYEGHTDTFDVEIISKKSMGIEITTKPLKTNYIQNYEDLDLDGGIITVTYNDKSKDTISLTNENVKVSGFDNSKIGKKTITVEYEGYTDTFDVEIISKQSVKVEVTTKPTKVEYSQNDKKLNLVGGIITVTYNDESKDTISLTNENVKVSGFDNSKIGKKTITVEYEGHTSTFDVNIVEASVVENPKTGRSNIIVSVVLIVLVAFGIYNLYLKKIKFI